MTAVEHYAIGTVRGAGPIDMVEVLADTRPDWHERAACRGTGVGAFFDETPEAEDAARRLCAGCSVVAACAEAGRREPAGIWAGRNPAERGRRRRRAG